MASTSDFDADVLIIGGGPTGVSVACNFLRLGIKCLIVDKAPAVTTARAMGISTRTLEVLRVIGVAKDVIREAVASRSLSIYADRKLILQTSSDVSELSSPTPYGAILPQNRVVAILEKRLQDLGGSVGRLCELTKLSQDDAGVTSIIEENGQSRTVRTKYVIGCDGAHSNVRKLLDLKFDGSDYEDRLLAADVFVDWNVSADGGHIFLGPTGTITAFPFPDARKWRIAIFGGNASADHGSEAIMKRVREVMKECGPLGAIVQEPVHTTYYGIHRRIVHNFRSGRCFIAGDAAHIHSPAGGQGMNTGIQDGFNLAWKLALVLRGDAEPKILETYQDERHPVAESVLKMTDRLTKLILPRSPLKAAIRSSALSTLGKLGLMGNKTGRALSQLDIKYSPSLLVQDGKQEGVKKAHRDAFATAPAAGERAPDVAIADGRLFDLLYRNDTRFTLLFFEGLERTEAISTINDFEAIAGRLNEDLLAIHYVRWPGFRKDSKQPVISILLDPDGTIHRKYGAIGPCLYLVRPDGYVGFRSQPPDAKGLQNYLKKVLRRPIS